MNKHLIAISFAFIGVCISGMVGEFKLEFVALGIGIGSLVGYFIAGLIQAKGDILQKEFIKMGDLQNIPLEEIIKKVGPQTSFQSCTIANKDNEPGYFYTWIANNYSITLLFDSNKKCIGVHSESKI